MNIYNILKPFSINEHYLKRYCNFISSRSKRPIPKNTYTENHHIHPSSLGGTNDNSNMIRLTAREHFIAHWILWKACGGKMSSAFFIMSHTDKYDTQINSKIYENLKIDFSKRRSDYMKNRVVSPETCKKLSEANKGKVYSDETRKKLSDALNGKSRPADVKDKISKSKKGKKLSEEHRQKLKEAWEKRRKNKVSDKTRKKMSKSKLGNSNASKKST